MTYAARDRLPFDIAGQRMQRYTLKKGKLDPAALKDERKAITEAIVATLGAWRRRRASPVYQTIPSLKEPDWKTLKVGDVNEFWEALESWQRRVEVARRSNARATSSCSPKRLPTAFWNSRRCGRRPRHFWI